MEEESDEDEEDTRSDLIAFSRAACWATHGNEGGERPDGGVALGWSAGFGRRALEVVEKGWKRTTDVADARKARKMLGESLY